MRNPFSRQERRQRLRSQLRAFDDLRAEWREYESTLNSYMERMNAWAARQAKRDKRLIEKTLDAEVTTIEQTSAPEPFAGGSGGVEQARIALASTILQRAHPAAALKIRNGGLAAPPAPPPPGEAG